MINNYAHNTDSKLVEIYHKLARKVTNFNHRVDELSDRDKISKLSAKLEIKLVKGEMIFRDIPVISLGYSL